MADRLTPVAAHPVPQPLQRLRRGADIRAVRRRGERREGRLLTLHAVTDGAGRPALAVVASGRVGGAVRRNRAKRLLREAARHLPWRGGLRLVATAAPACAESGRDAVEGELAELAGELGLLTDGEPAHA